MQKIIKSHDGKYYKGEFEEISAEVVTSMIAHQQQELSDLEAIAPKNEATGETLQPQAPAPVDQVAAQPEQAVPAPTDPAQPAPQPQQAEPAQPAAPQLQ